MKKLNNYLWLLDRLYFDAARALSSMALTFSPGVYIVYLSLECLSCESYYYCIFVAEWKLKKYPGSPQMPGSVPARGRGLCDSGLHDLHVCFSGQSFSVICGGKFLFPYPTGVTIAFDSMAGLFQLDPWRMGYRCNMAPLAAFCFYTVSLPLPRPSPTHHETQLIPWVDLP